jgi:hypothetical protein
VERINLEPSFNCKYDYLEIRDGEYGYSPLIGRYCESIPLEPPLQTTGSVMWIKFFSDDSIQLDGFKLSYEFKKMQSSEKYKLIENMLSNRTFSTFKLFQIVLFILFIVF